MAGRKGERKSERKGERRAQRRVIADRRRIGGSGLVVTCVGIGTWSWGEKRLWTYGEDFDRKDIDQVWGRALELGASWFDTAEMYGDGASEAIIGELLAKEREPPMIATKFFPDRKDPKDVRKAAQGSLRRLGLDVLDLYQVHWPPEKMALGDLMREMEALVDDNLVANIGVSNFSVAEVEEAQGAMSGAKIASNQVHYSLLHREPEDEGLVEHHRRAGITIIAYSPLEQGLLTGKFTPSRPPGGFRARKPRFSPENLGRAKPLLDELKAIGDDNGRTAGQVALAWLLKDPNVVVIPGAKNLKQLEEDMGCADWLLTGKELDRIEGAYLDYRDAGGV